MNERLAERILSTLKMAGRNGMRFADLMQKCRVTRGTQSEFRVCLETLEKQGKISDTRSLLFHNAAAGIGEAVVTRLSRTFGFARRESDGVEIFIPGKFFMGAMVGDRVMVSPIPSRGASPEGQIVRILEFGPAEFTGTMTLENGIPFVQPDGMIRFAIRLTADSTYMAEPGDKIRCTIARRGKSHAEHVARVLQSYGDSQTAVHCAEAILDLNGIRSGFPLVVRDEANTLAMRGIRAEDLTNRTDLRHLPIFTIDSADSKDLDDAISIERTETGYLLGVHIADVSHYVRAGRPLDDEAFKRGTSIYFADRVIPMLPKALSNDICSLNPDEDRLAFSCFISLGKDGAMQGYRFEKAVIRSRVKGVYKEVNAILAGNAGEDLLEKYSGLTDSIYLMKELADILTARKRGRGSPEIETSESYIVLDEHNVAVDILPRTRGESEVMIEEFMLTANEAAAAFAKEKKIPFVYRVHEPPLEDKLDNLHDALRALGQPTNDIKPGLPAKALAEALELAKGEPCFPLINVLVLRSMSKAKYFEEPLGHYSLVLENYAQFTSPIRRYPDLTIHRILSDVVEDVDIQKIQEKYHGFVKKSAAQSTATEINAMTLERQCEDCYKAEYMKSRVGEEFDGYISSLAPHGMYVELPNTVEGLIRNEALPEGEYERNEMISLKNLTDGTVYRIGDPIRIKCVASDVSGGKIDFVIAE